MSKFDIIPPVPGKPIEIKEESLVPYGAEENIIADTNSEINAFINSLKSDSAKEKIIKAKNTDARFFFAVYFQDSEQKEAFLRAIGADKLTAGQYINGLEFAKLLGIEIEKKDVKIPGKFKNFSINK